MAQEYDCFLNISTLC